MKDRYPDNNEPVWELFQKAGFEGSSARERVIHCIWWLGGARQYVAREGLERMNARATWKEPSS